MKLVCRYEWEWQTDLTKLNENEKLIVQMYVPKEWETEEGWGKATSLIQHST